MTRRLRLLVLVVLAIACRSENTASQSIDTSTSAPSVDSGFAAVADSAWVDVNGPTLVGFYPIRTNEQLEKDEGLATALDDFAYHIGTAMDSLYAQGFTVHYRGGDTLWLRTPSKRWRFVRDVDSTDVGYVMTDTARNVAMLYGVRGYVDLIAYAHEFRSTGASASSRSSTPRLSEAQPTPGRAPHKLPRSALAPRHQTHGKRLHGELTAKDAKDRKGTTEN